MIIFMTAVSIVVGALGIWLVLWVVASSLIRIVKTIEEIQEIKEKSELRRKLLVLRAKVEARKLKEEVK